MMIKILSYNTHVGLMRFLAIRIQCFITIKIKSTDSVILVLRFRIEYMLNFLIHVPFDRVKGSLGLMRFSLVNPKEMEKK